MFQHYYFVQASTWGLAFELLGETALKYLNDRECTKGGYETLITTFFPRNGVMTPFPVLVFRATEHNPQVIIFSFCWGFSAEEILIIFDNFRCSGWVPPHFLMWLLRYESQFYVFFLWYYTSVTEYVTEYVDLITVSKYFCSVQRSELKSF